MYMLQASISVFLISDLAGRIKVSFQPNRRINTASIRVNLERVMAHFCVFCIRNGRSFEIFSSHNLRTDYGKITCPELRSCICPICFATGDDAHTRKYCPNRKKLGWEQTKDICGFCKQKGEPPEQYTNHILKDSKGSIMCPILRSYVCPLCGATGENAHTKTYCPITIEQNNGIRPIAPCLLLRRAKNENNV